MERVWVITSEDKKLIAKNFGGISYVGFLDEEKHLFYKTYKRRKSAENAIKSNHYEFSPTAVLHLLKDEINLDMSEVRTNLRNKLVVSQCIINGSGANAKIEIL